MITKNIKRSRFALTALALACQGAWAADGLLDVYHLAAQGDPQLRSAESAYLGVTEGKTQARAQLRPQVTAGANLSRTRQEVDSSGLLASGTDYYTTKGLNLNLTQTLYRRDQFVQLSQADALTSQAEARYNNARQDLIVRVAQRYLDVLNAQDNLTFTLAEKEAIERQLDQAKQRFDVGLIALPDVNSAQAAYDLAVSQHIEAQNGLETARESLREITGQLHTELRGVRDDLPLSGPNPADIEQWTATALNQNLGIQAARFGVEASREDVERNRAGHYPTLDAVASHGYSDIGGGSFGGRQTTDTTVGLQFNVPIYQGGGTNSRIREAQYRYDQAQQDLEQQRRAALHQTRDAYLGINSAISRSQALKQAVVSNQSSLDATQAGFEVGTRTMVDVLDAQRQVFRAKRDYARARYDYILSELRLKQAAGTLATADLEMVNGWLQ